MSQNRFPSVIRDATSLPSPVGSPAGALGPPAASLSPEVLTAAREREPGALDVFFEHYFDAVYAMVRRLVNDPDAADDISQEVFYRIHRGIGRIDPARDPSPWITTVAYNTCRDYWRSRAYKRKRQTDALPDDACSVRAIGARGGGPETAAAAHERQRLVQRAISRLPVPLRETVVLHDYHGFAHDEIASIVGDSHAAVRKRYSRALAELAKQLRGILT